MPPLPIVTKSTPLSRIFDTSLPVLIFPATVKSVSIKSMSVKCFSRLFCLCSSSFGSLKESHREISIKSIFLVAIKDSQTSFISASFKPNPSGDNRTPKIKSLPHSFLTPSTISKIILDLFSIEPP